MFSSPPLPAAQVDGINGVTMGNFTKIFLQWKERFAKWPSRGAQWLAATDRAADPHRVAPMEFHDLGRIDARLGATLFCYVVGDASVVWEAMDDAAAMKAIVARLSVSQKHLC